MGMTDMQFKSHRRMELSQYKDVLSRVKKAEVRDADLIKNLEEMIKQAEYDLQISGTD